MLLEWMSILFKYIIIQTSKKLEKRLFINYQKTMGVLVRLNSIMDYSNNP